MSCSGGDQFGHCHCRHSAPRTAFRNGVSWPNYGSVDEGPKSIHVSFMYNLYIGQLCYIFSFVKSNKCNQVILPSAFAYPNLNHKVFGGPGRPNWNFNIFSVHCEYVHIRKTLVLNVDWGKQKSWLIYWCNVSQGATSCNPIQPAARSDADLRQALQKQLQSARSTLKQQRQKLQDALDNNQVTKWGIGGGHEWYYL